MLSKEGMTTAKARSAMSTPQSIKHALLAKTQSNIGKIEKHCTKNGMTNHNVETCKKKKEQTMVATMEPTQLRQKTKKKFSYVCHIYGWNDIK